MQDSEQYDYKALPITTAAANESIDQGELEDNTLLRGILEGRISLEERLDTIPRLHYDFHDLKGRTSRYHGASMAELRTAWKEGYREVEIQVTQSWLSRLLERARGGLEGIIFDKKEEVVVDEQLSLEERRDNALKDLKEARKQDKKYLNGLKQARASLQTYRGNIEQRLREDEITLGSLARFGLKLEEEINSTKRMVEGNNIPLSEAEAYREQVIRGQEYFDRLTKQTRYMKREIGLLTNSTEKSAVMLSRMNGLIDTKEHKLMEAHFKIAEAEMTRDWGSIIEAADYLVDLDTDVQEAEEIIQEARDLMDAAFDVVDNVIDTDTVPVTENSDVYRNNLYNQRTQEFHELIDGI